MSRKMKRQEHIAVARSQRITTGQQEFYLFALRLLSLKAIFEKFDTESVCAGTVNITLFYGCIILHDGPANVTLYLLCDERSSFVVVRRLEVDGVWPKQAISL
jgi:hypothetical protein